MRGVFRPKGSRDWWIHWYDHEGRRHREKVGANDAAAALYHKRKAESLLLRKVPELVHRRQATMADLLADTEAYIKRNHQNGYSDLVRVGRIRAGLGTRPAASVRPADLDSWIAGLERKPATANRYKSLLSLTFRLAMEAGKAESNPARKVRRRAENNERIRWLTAEEEKKLMFVVDAIYRPHSLSVQFALHTGLRLSEQIRLAWADVDWTNRVITIRRSKHGKARYVPLNDQAYWLVERIARQRKRPEVPTASGKPLRDPPQGATRPSLLNNLDTRHTPDNDDAQAQDDSRTGHSPSPGMSTILEGHSKRPPRSPTKRYGAKRGRPELRIFDDLRPDARWMKTAARAAGVADLTWHDLRHTFASRLRMAGVELVDIKDLLGHKTMVTTLRYAHLSPQKQRQAVQKLVQFGHEDSATAKKDGKNEETPVAAKNIQRKIN
jgi:integrase